MTDESGQIGLVGELAAPDPVPTPLESPYATVAEAEKMLMDTGYVRDAQRHVWVNSGDTAKVVHTNDMQFSVQRG